MAQIDLTEVLGDANGLKPDDCKIPDSVWSVLEDIPFYVDDTADEGVMIVYERAKQGHCMCCDGPLGELTMLGLNMAGIVLIFCCGACHTDMQVTGWIEEQYEDIVQKIKFRGGHGDQAP